MSERKAKLKRQNEIKETPKKKKSAVDIISNIIIVLLVLAVLGIGGWAVYPKISQMSNNNADNEVVTPTVLDYATSAGTSVEQFITDFGLVGAEIVGETPITDAISKMTLSNYAKFSNTDVASVKQTMGITKDYTDDTLMGVIIDEMAKEAENNAQNNAETAE